MGQCDDSCSSTCYRWRTNACLHESACPPSSHTQVHFLRVILDEGHDLGSLQATNKLQVIPEYPTAAPKADTSVHCLLWSGLHASQLPPGLYAPCTHLQTARDLLAERRWVMTGTPTPSAKDSSSGVAHLQPLLDFLGHVPYGTNGRFVNTSPRSPDGAHCRTRPGTAAPQHALEVVAH
jgi:hypothetical protein